MATRYSSLFTSLGTPTRMPPIIESLNSLSKMHSRGRSGSISATTRPRRLILGRAQPLLKEPLHGEGSKGRHYRRGSWHTSVPSLHRGAEGDVPPGRP